MLLETNITREYLPNWGLVQGYREIAANAMDAEVDGLTSTYSWSKTRTVRWITQGAQVDVKNLLLGVSGSRADDRKRGQFGEGLPVALMVLTREGHKPRVRTKDAIWYPQFVYSKKWGAEVFAIDVKPRPNEGADEFVVEINNVDSETWTSTLMEVFLATNHHHRSDTMVLGGKGRMVLTHPRFRGKVYNKGVHVTDSQTLLFGYDLRLETNRDRSIVQESHVAYEAACALNIAAEDNEAVRDAVVTSLMSGAVLDEFRSYYYLFRSTAVARAAREAFVRAHGDRAVPVSSDNQANAAVGLSIRPVVVSEPLRSILESVGLSLEHAREKIRTTFTVVSEPDRGDSAALKATDHALKLWGSNAVVEVVEFADASVFGLFNEPVGDSPPVVQIGKNAIARGTAFTLQVLAHEVAHAYGKDGSATHYEVQIDLLTKLLAHYIGD